MRRTKPIKVPTTGTFDFETLITSESGKYVDKTALLYELARHKADAQLFISRPRRFGYADAVIEMPSAVYVFEFKYRKSAKAARRQIRERDYAAKWAGGPRPVTLIGINFNPKKRNIDMPIVEPL